MSAFRRSQIKAFMSLLLGIFFIALFINNKPPGDLNFNPSLQHEQILEIEAETDEPFVNSADEPIEKDYELSTGEFPKGSMLKGLVFDPNTPIGGNYTSQFSSYITTSVVKSFSPMVENHVKQIFNDEYGECKFYATLPAMVLRGNEIEVVQRIWLAQYETMKSHYKTKGKNMEKMVKEWKNTWQENYLYSMRLDENYNLIRPGNILGLPTTTNAAFTYKSDGPMDPRLFTLGEDTYLSFHTWLVDPTFNDQITGRLHMYDMDRHIKRKLKLNTKLHRTEINWIPIDVKGELYYTYSLDPLRVMKCDKNTADCQFVYEQPGTKEYPFVYSSDHLRGGTPWIQYRYPYYIGVAHNVVVTKAPSDNYSIYNSNLVVLCVDPWRIVYVSSNLELNGGLLTSTPVIRNQTIIMPFFYPAGIILRNSDVIDISGHLNDATGHVVRISGIKNILERVISSDINNNARMNAPPVRAVQQYVLESMKSSFLTWKFRGDITEGTVEQPGSVSL